MYLNKYPFLSKKYKIKHFSTFSSPFSNINVTKFKSKILEKVLEFQEKEENCISLINYNLLFKIKQRKKQKKILNNNLNDSLSNTMSNSKEINDEINSLDKNIKAKGSFLNKNFSKTKTNFPFIKRNQRKIKTFSLFKTIQKKVKFNDLLLETPNNEKDKIKKDIVNKQYSLSSKYNNIELISNNDSYINTNTNNYFTSLNNDKKNKCAKFLKNESMKDINNLNQIKFDNQKNFYFTNNYFSLQNNQEEKYNKELIDLKKPLKKSYSSFNSKNIKFLKNIMKNNDILIPVNNHKKLSLRNFSNKSITNYKSLSILKKPEIKKESLKSIYSLNRNNFFLTSSIDKKNNINNNNDINDINNEKTNSSYFSHSKNSSCNDDIAEKKSRIQYNDKSKNTKIKKEKTEENFKKLKKIFKIRIKNKIKELEKEIKKDIKENNNNVKINKLLIKYMIKKCKYIYKMIEQKMKYEIMNLDKEYDKNEVILNLTKKQSEAALVINNFYKNGGNKSNDNLKYKNINKNRHIIYNLIDKNLQMEYKVNAYIDKLLEKI